MKATYESSLSANQHQNEHTQKEENERIIFLIFFVYNKRMDSKG